MDWKLVFNAVGKFLAGLLLVAGLAFLPAGTWHYWNAWLLIGILFAPMLALGVVLLAANPELLRKRLKSRETEQTQKAVVALTAALFLAAFVVAGLNFRFSWCVLPRGVAIAAAIVFLLGYALYAEVMRENAYLSRTVEVQAGQKVIDTGLYGVIRHPMYTATLLMFLSLPLVLGSPLSFVIMLGYVPVLLRRIKNEEAVLESGLPGYTEYKTRVKFRLIPHIW